MRPQIRRAVAASFLAAAVFGAGFAAVRAQEAKEIAEKLAAIRDAAADASAVR
jgi:hypothetical protein